MAENFNFTPGAGAVGAADDIAGVKYPQVKLVSGLADSVAGIYAGVGAAANSLRVAPADDITDATYIGDIKFGEAEPNSAAIKTAVELIDNAIDGAYLNVNLNIVGTDVSANAGVLTAQTLRVTIATDDEVNNLLGTIDADTGNMVTALQLLDNAIDGNYLNVNLNVAGTDAAAGEGVISAQTQRVTIATDDDGVAHLATLAGAVTATHMQCDIVAGTVTTVSTVSTITNVVHVDDNSSTLSIDDGAGAITVDWAGTAPPIGTGTEAGALRVTIANNSSLLSVIGAQASAAGSAGTIIMGVAYTTALPTDVGADADAARLVTDRYGRLCTGLQPQAAKATLDNADTTTAREVVAATATRRIFVTSLILSVDTAGNYWLEDGDATAVTGKFYLAANGGVAVTFPEGTPLNTVTQNKALNVKGSTAGNVSVTVTYYLAV